MKTRNHEQVFFWPGLVVSSMNGDTYIYEGKEEILWFYYQENLLVD